MEWAAFVSSVEGDILSDGVGVLEWRRKGEGKSGFRGCCANDGPKVQKHKGCFQENLVFHHGRNLGALKDIDCKLQ